MFIKSLERAARRLALGLVSQRRGSNIEEEITLPARPQILLIRTDRIGDAVISTPTVARLRRRYPDARITMLFGAKNAAIAALLPDLDERAVLPVSLPGALTVLRQLRARRYDLVINLLAGGSATAALVTGFVRGRWSIGFAGEGERALTHVVPQPEQPEHMAITTSRLLAPLGLPPLNNGEDESDRLRLRHSPPLFQRGGREGFLFSQSGGTPPNPLPRSESRASFGKEGEQVLLLPSVGDPARRWTTENWITLARTLIGEGTSVALLGTVPDSEMIAEIARASGATSLPPSRSLDNLAAVAAGASTVIAPDTASVHIVAATGVPIVMLAGEVRSARMWYPWGVPFRIVRGRSGVADISVSEVAAAFRDLQSTLIKNE